MRARFFLPKKEVDVIVVGRAFSFPFAVVSVADLSRQKIQTETGFLPALYALKRTEQWQTHALHARALRVRAHARARCHALIY